MTFSMFLNSLPELYLSFTSEPKDCCSALTYLCVLVVLIYVFCYLSKVLFDQLFLEDEEPEESHQGRAKRRRKGGTWKGCRHWQMEKEDIKMLIYLLKSPLGRHHNSILFRRLLCPDPYCVVCNDATTEMDQLLSSLAFEDATLSMSPLASTTSVTESAVPPGNLIPPPLPEPFPLAPSNLSTSPVTSLGDFPSHSPLVRSLPSESLPPLESEFAVDSSPPLPLALPSLPTHDTQSVETPPILNTIFIDTSITQDINPSPDVGLTLNPTTSVTYHVPQTMSVSPPPHYSLTMTQPEPIHSSSKPALEDSSPDSTGALAIYVPQGTDHPSLLISDISCQEAYIKGSLPSTLTQYDLNQFQDVGYDSKNNPESCMMSPSGANLTVSEESQGQGQSEDTLKVHLSKKFGEITTGQLPVTVQSSFHVIKQTLSMQPHSEIEQRSLAKSVSEENCLDTCQELSFIESNAQQMLEDHITMFNLRMVWGLPTKVLQSLELSKSRDTLSHSFLDDKISSSNAISEVVSKPEGFTHLRGSSETFNQPYSATSLMGQKGQGTLRQPPSEIAYELAEEVPRIPNTGQTLLPVANSMNGKQVERDIPRANIPPPMLPIRQTRTGQEPKDQSMGSSQGKEMKKLEPVSMPKVFRAEELDALQYKMSGTLTTSKLGISPRPNVSESKGVTTVTSTSLPAKASVVQDLKSENIQKALMEELKCKLEKRKQSQAQGQHTHVSHASDSLAYKASLAHPQGVSSVDGAAPQVLHVHSANTGVSMEQPQEPWLPKKISTLCQDKNFPPAAKARPTGSTSEEVGGGDAGLGTSQPGRNVFPTGNQPLKEKLGTKFPKTPSQTAQPPPPPESVRGNQTDLLFQWLHPELAEGKQQEYSQERGHSLSSARSRDPNKSGDVFTGFFLDKKPGRHHAVEIDITCPQKSLPSALKFANVQQVGTVWTWAEPNQEGHPLNCRCSRCRFKATNTQTFCQEAAFSNKNKKPWKVEALKDQLVGQKQFQSVPIKGDYAPSKYTQAFYQEAAFSNKKKTPRKVVALKDQLVGQKQFQSVPIKGDYAPSKYTQAFYQEAAFSNKKKTPRKVVALKDQLVDQKQLQSVPIKGDYAPSKPHRHTSRRREASCCRHCCRHCAQRCG